MSRIGKKPIIIDQQINVQLDGQSLIISGPLGELSLVIPYQIEVINKNQSLLVQANSRDNKAICLTGTFRQIINNMVLGVTEGFKKSLELKGIGYRAFLEDGGLKLQLGFSHPIIFTPPSGIELKVEKNIIIVSGVDKQLVGEVAAKIRRFRKVEPYKGKGIRYLGEQVRTKVGKAAKAATA